MALFAINAQGFPGRRWRADALMFAAVSLVFLIDALRLLDEVVAISPAGVPGITLDRCIVVAGVLAVCGIGALAYRRGALTAQMTIALGAICGLVFFARSLGTSLADPTRIDWILTGNDWSQHFAGWETYRTAPWTWPPGLNPYLWYPIGTSIVFSDSMPLFAMPAKLIRNWLPEPFQYIGITLALNCLLQGVFGALLMRRAKATPAATLSGCLLFLFAPVLLWRIGHDTLTSQWLLLAALWLYFGNDTSSIAHRTFGWCALAAIAALMHPYLPPMVLAIAFAYCVRRTVVDREGRWSDGIVILGSMLSVVALSWYLSGTFLLRAKDTSGGVPLGVYTSNLLTFVDPAGYSSVLPPIPGVPPEQWEGAAYLGIGVFALLAVLIIVGLLRRQVPSWPRRHWPLLVVIAITAALAFSGTLKVGAQTLTNWTPHSQWLAAYRASGRFIWVAFYALMFATVYGTVRVLPRASPVALGIALFMQMWDFDPVQVHFATLRSGAGWPAPEKLLADARWDDLLANRHHLTMLPPESCGNAARPHLPFQLLAARHAATFNSGYLARANSKKTANYCIALGDDIAANHYSDDELYVIGPDLAHRVADVAGMQCETLDGFLACTYSRPR